MGEARGNTQLLALVLILHFSMQQNAVKVTVGLSGAPHCLSDTQECDEVLQRQFEELSRGLVDSAPAVRMTAAAGICAVLNVYWELVPAGVTAAYLKRLTGLLHSGITLTVSCHTTLFWRCCHPEWPCQPVGCQWADVVRAFASCAAALHTELCLPGSFTHDMHCKMRWC